MSTSIEWTDETWNPLRGCRRISPGCEHCYAERQAARPILSGPGLPYQGLVQIGRQGPRWTGATAGPDQLDVPLRWKKPRKVFPCSMSDLFFEEHSDEQIAAVFGAMAAAPQHTFQVLTKRIERARAWFEWVQRREQHGRSLFPHDSPGWRIRQMLTAPVPPICPRRPPLCIVEDMPVPKKKPDAPPAQEPKGRGRPPKASEPAGEPKSANEPKQKTSFSLPGSALTKLRLWAAARGVDMTAIIEEAVLEKLERDREQIERDVQTSLSAKD